MHRPNEYQRARNAMREQLRYLDDDELAHAAYLAMNAIERSINQQPGLEGVIMSHFPDDLISKLGKQLKHHPSPLRKFHASKAGFDKNPHKNHYLAATIVVAVATVSVLCSLIPFWLFAPAAMAINASMVVTTITPPLILIEGICVSAWQKGKDPKHVWQ